MYHTSIRGTPMKKKTKTIQAKPKKLSISAPSKPKSNLYDVDFYKWANAQAKLIKTEKFKDVDIENLVEEIETLGRSEKNALKSHMINLFLHLLKCDYQPERRSKSWDDSILEAERQIEDILEDSPSLKKLIPTLNEKAYSWARRKAINETNLHEDCFPKECPKSYQEYLKFGKK